MITERRARLALRLALAAVLLGVFSFTRADPDLWGHIRFGGDMIAARTVHIPDSYSFTSDRSWVNHEWLAECAMWAAYACAGSAGLILLKIGLLVAMIGAVAWILHRQHVPDAARDFLLGVVVVATVQQANNVRPQLFSLALFAWLLAILVEGGGGLLWVVPMLALWANLHGGWIVGLGVLGTWVALSSLPRHSPRETVAPAGARWRPALMALSAAAATLANPYGWRLWMFLRETVGFGRADIAEWQSVLSSGYAVTATWLIVAACALAAARHMTTSGRPDIRAIAIVAMLGMASFRVSRLLAFFGLALVMLLGRDLAEAAARIGAVVTTRAQGRSEDRPLQPHDRRGRPSGRPAVAVAMALVLLAGSITTFARNATCVRMDLPFFPDERVAAAVNSLALRGRMLVWFDWGEYAIWHLAPQVSVSIDGRRETVYSDEVIRRHLRFYYVPDERRAVLDALRPDYIWLPSELPVTPKLVADGWTPLASGDRSMLLARGDAKVGMESFGVPPVPRCFPGP